MTESNKDEMTGQGFPEKLHEQGDTEDDEQIKIKNIVTEILSQRGIVAEAVDRAPDEEEQEILAAAVENANTLEARKTAVTTAIKTAQDSRSEKEILAIAVENASNIEARKSAVKTAIETARDENEKEIVHDAVESTSTLAARKSAAATAVNTASSENRQAVAREAVEQLSSETQKNLAHHFLPSREAADKIWLMIVRTFATVLVVGIAGLVGVVILAIFREVDKDLVQIMLTVFSTVTGILAGFITGQAVGASSSR